VTGKINIIINTTRRYPYKQAFCATRALKLVEACIQHTRATGQVATGGDHLWLSWLVTYQGIQGSSVTPFVWRSVLSQTGLQLGLAWLHSLI